MLKHAPAAIAVVGDPTNERFGPYWMQDCAAAVENMLLTIESLGLGGVWLGVYPREERVEGFRNLLRLPKGVIPLAFIVIGYPAQTPAPQDRFQEDRIHHNGW